MKRADKHLFAVYVAELSTQHNLHVGSKIIISNEDVAHRVLIVLRLAIGEELILFDDQKSAVVTITDSKKNKVVTVTVNEISSHSKSRLTIEFILPLLKREALEEAVYLLTEIGVSTISLVITDKSQKQLTDKEFQRLQKIQIAAAEQSKNFNIPVIHKPITLEGLVTPQKRSATAILFDPHGKPALELFTNLTIQKVTNLSAIVGPEGGFTSSEIQLLKDNGFIVCKLTSTVLRAVQAISIGSGLIASLL